MSGARNFSVQEQLSKLPNATCQVLTKMICTFEVNRKRVCKVN